MNVGERMRIPSALSKVFNRAGWLYLAVMVILAWAVNDQQSAKERGRYLLGIFYNQELKNYKDGVVYFDYLVHSKPGEARNYFFLGYCYLQLKDYQKALRNFETASGKAPQNTQYRQYADYAKKKLVHPDDEIPYPPGDLNIPVE